MMGKIFHKNSIKSKYFYFLNMYFVKFSQKKVILC